MKNSFPFHERLRYERERRGWSQADLAEKMKCDTKTIGRWESGESLPRPYHRQALSEILGKNLEELGLLQEIALLPLQKMTETDPPMPIIKDTSNQDSSEVPREDWGEAPSVVNLYGRDIECAEIGRWITEGNCRVGVILGAGGVGKTAIATIIATQVNKTFEFFFWRSVQDAPPFEHFLKQCIVFLSKRSFLELPGAVEDQISLLIQYLRDHRCLLVLDNFETLLQEGRSAGHYRDDYTAYGRLLQRVGETQHQSCLLITSREKPKEIAHLEGKNSPVRSFPLAGLELEAGQHMLQNKRLVGSHTHWLGLIECYSGNPLALQLVSEYIREIFAGDIARFLLQETIAFGDINDILAQQFQRLSSQEQEIMYWLAIEREATALEDLSNNLVYPRARGIQIETLDSLLRRSLIEKRGPGQFTLQAVIMEYVTTNLVMRAHSEFETEALEVWMQYAFSKAQAKGYIRESQERLILAPLAQHLLSRFGKEGVGLQAKALLKRQRQTHTRQPSYLAGNLLNLLRYSGCDLRGFDFSHLIVRQAYLQGMMLPDVNFAHAHFIASIFTSTFGNILAVAYNSQEPLLAAGTASGEIWIYETPVSILRFICHGHTDGVWSLAFSPDGTVLASSSDDHTIRLWKSSSGHCLKILQGHTSRVRTIAFSSDGTLLASGSDDHTIRLWNFHTGECLMTLLDHTDRVWSIAFHPSGKLLASGSTDQTVRVWDLSTQNCLLILQGHSGWVRSVTFHPKDDMLASGSDDQTIRLWNIHTGQCINTMWGHTNRVWSVAFSPDGDALASGSEDQTIRLWNSATGDCFQLLQGHTQGVRSIAFSPHEQLLASGGEDQTIRVWDNTAGRCLHTVQGYTNRVWSIAFSLDGSVLAHGSEDTTIRLWDSKTGHCLKVLRDRQHGVLVVACAPDRFEIASGGQDQTVRVWDGNTGRCLARLSGHTNWVRAVSFSPDGKILASGSEDQTIRLWDLRTHSHSNILQGHTSWVRSVAFNPDGSILASGADDQTIRLWNVTDGRCVNTLEGHTNRVRSVAFSPDGKILASGSEDGTIRLWDFRTGHCFVILQRHSGWVRSVAFSPDGKILASGNEDGTIHLWDVSTRQCLQTLQSHTNRIRQIGFSPDDLVFASSSDDGTVKLWERQTAMCIKTLVSERPYEHMNITGVQGLTAVQKASLKALGAIEEH